MEAISYVNIFETKGIEYLLVITFMLGFLLFTRFVCASGRKAVQAGAEAEIISSDFACAASFECPFKRVLAEGEQGLDEEAGAA